MTIVVVDYDPAWPLLFEELHTTVWPAVAGVATSIEHVGSTAVPGLAAKPVIDLDVVVAPGRVSEGVERLAELGYGPRGNLGIPGRQAFRAPADTAGRHHLYLCPADSPALANHLAVRDFLRAHPERVREYGRLKKRLAAEFMHDVDGYVEGKSDFLLGILRASGFDTAALGDIERMNRRPRETRHSARRMRS
jgi:GrpB-like predicted nucleotidyltransferase (UPF0157 family)